jgi:hypothetical protein
MQTVEVKSVQPHLPMLQHCIPLVHAVHVSGLGDAPLHAAPPPVEPDELDELELDDVFPSSPAASSPTSSPTSSPASSPTTPLLLLGSPLLPLLPVPEPLPLELLLPLAPLLLLLPEELEVP